MLISSNWMNNSCWKKNKDKPPAHLLQDAFTSRAAHLMWMPRPPQKSNAFTDRICLYVVFYLPDLCHWPYSDTLSCHLAHKEQSELQFITPLLHLCMRVTPSNPEGEGPRGQQMSCCREGEPASTQPFSPNIDFYWSEVAATQGS